MAVCECNVVVAQTLSYPAQLATHRHPPLLHQNRTLVCIAARAFSALCALHAVLIGFPPVKIDVGSIRDFKSFSYRD
jgi:hypothetical protein